MWHSNIHDKLQVYRLILTVLIVHNDDLMDGYQNLNAHLSISLTHTKRGQQHDLVRYDLLSILPQSPLFPQQHPVSGRERWGRRILTKTKHPTPHDAPWDTKKLNHSETT